MCGFMLPDVHSEPGGLGFVAQIASVREFGYRLVHGLWCLSVKSSRRAKLEDGKPDDVFS